MNEVAIFGLWASVFGLAAQAAESRGERAFMWVYRVLFVVNGLICIAALLQHFGVL